jgi:hypothetical protein
LSSGDDPIGVVVLATEPEGSSPAFSEEVLDRLPTYGGSELRTVVVLSPEDIGVTSDAWDDQAIDAALDESIDQLRADPVAGFEALAAALEDQETIAEEDDSSGFNPLLLVAGGAGVAALVFGRRLLPSGGGYAGDDSSYSRRRRWSSFSSRSRRSSSGSRSRGSSGGSRRGRGGRRL